MKVLLVNGSPHEKGCTYTALAEVAAALEQEGIETEIFSIGRKPVGGCVDCGGCGRPEKRGSCVFGDPVNACLEKAAQADGFVFGAPVYYAGVAGSMRPPRAESVRFEACGRGDFGAPGRHDGHARPPEQVFPVRPDAGHFLVLLEHGPRQYAGGGAAG